MIRIGISGVAGRMGRSLAKVTHLNQDMIVVAGFERPGSSFIGVEIGELYGEVNDKVVLKDSLDESTPDFDILVDFTIPENTLKNVKFCKKHNKKMVIGTTGFSDKERIFIEEAAKEIAIVMAPNYSIGINLILKLLEKATKVMGSCCDIEILEAHHRCKVDIPSGTAVRMGEVIAETMGNNLSDVAFYNQDSNCAERINGGIGFSTIRSGDIVGEHTVMFVGVAERIEITHKASDRMAFANGAIRAVAWLNCQKDAGLFTMIDVLGLSNL
ncbi:4-hydroxy-tetrahydrodipicolinate reductase [Candidatus Photodesmus blepharus]|nr:4-hydroxy-tetrahydrodipicolinate reductase [Candidatus Photodesmus blepharus]